MRLSDCHNIADLRRMARRRAHRTVFDYIDGGSDDERTLARNTAGFDDIALPHRVLRDVSTVDTHVTILGKRHPLPFFLSPTAGNRLFHTDGERAVARAAGAAGIISGLSTLSTVSIEEIGALTSAPKWFQCYVWKDRVLVSEMLARARAAGFEAMVLTADFAVAGNRERDLRNGFAIPPRLSAPQAVQALAAPAWTWDYLRSDPITYANLPAPTTAQSLHGFVADQLDPSFTWVDAERLLQDWNGEAVLKGVVDPRDAAQAAALGFNAVMVSNHGGRQLDGGVAPVDALPSIVDAVGDRLDVILDGGVRRGTHILKALALGATAVSAGRPYLYGLAAAGEAGVTRAIDLLAEAVRRDMALVGCSSIDEVRDLKVKYGSDAG